jgi:hypothetical protein
MPRPAPVQTRAATPAPAAADTESTRRRSPRHLALRAGGRAAIVFGFMMLAGGSTVGAPLLLMLGFAVLVPLGVIL